MASQATTYAQVRDYVQQTVGDGCDISDEKIIANFSSCLQNIWTDIRTHVWFRRSWDINLAPGQTFATLPAGLETITKVTDPLLCAELKMIEAPCNPPTVAPPVEECDCCCDDCCNCNKTESSGCWTVPKNGSNLGNIAKPTGYYITGDSGEYRIGFDVAPQTTCTLRIEGVRAPDCVFWDERDTGDEKVREWRVIDLPPRFAQVFKKCAVAEFMADCDDYGAHDFYMNSAANLLKSLIESGDTPSIQNNDVICIGGGMEKSDCPSSFRKSCTAPNIEYCGGVLEW